MNKLEAVERKIRELVPRTMELRFGCRAEEVYTGEEFIWIDFGYLWQSKRNFNVRIEDTPERFKIIGHPITLEDVLDAIGMVDGGRRGISVDVEGEIFERYYDDVADSLNIYWHFGKLFRDQTELIDWLYYFFNLSECTNTK